MAETAEIVAAIQGTLSPEIKEAKEAAQKALTSHTELAKEFTRINEEGTKWRKELEEESKAKQEAFQKDFNSLATEVKMLREGGIQIVQPGAGLDFQSSLAKAIGANAKSIQEVRKSKGIALELPTGTHMHRMDAKAASNMTTSGNLTGSPNITYIPQPVILPRQLVNFRDLVPGFQSETGLIALFRENGITSPQEGAFAQQVTQGALKEQVGYDFTNVQFTAEYISGYVRISKQMLQDVLFLQTYLPQMLIRDYYKTENATFFAAQNAAALGSTTTSGGNDAEKFIDYITNLENTNFAPNGIVTTPAIWGKLMKTTVPSIGTSYSVPGGFYINPMTGYIEIAGIPVIKATWMASGTALIADWTQSQVATVDGLKVEFFEQDSDNVQRNLITVRVEARVVLITGQPYAFTYATGL